MARRKRSTRRASTRSTARKLPRWKSRDGLRISDFGLRISRTHGLGCAPVKAEAAAERRLSPIVAALASLVVPGAGQILAGSRTRGFGLLIGLPIQAFLLVVAGQRGMLPWLGLV